MKFAKFALLCAIAVLLFATPRSANAVGWVDDGYFTSLGPHHGLNYVWNNTSVTAFGLGYTFSDVSISSTHGNRWAGPDPTILTVTVSAYLDASATYPGTAVAHATIFGLSVASGGPPGVHITASHPVSSLAGEDYLSVITELYAGVSGSGLADAGWSVN